MKNFDKIGEDLFNKIRGRFPNVTIGDEEGNITNEPEQARFFDFDYRSGERKLGKVSVGISEDNGLTVIYSRDFIQNEDELTQKEWYNFLRELRKFSKKRLLNFDVRDITKTNLTKRDYKFLAANRPGDETMNESKLYGTGRVSYQNVDDARIVIKHNENIDQENPAARTRNINSIYIESSEGERFKYPYRHLSGARAMARHVAEGGNPYDDFGSHISELSEEMWKLRKFKNYVGRSAVMAESLEGYMDIVKERVTTIKKTIENLQKPNYYRETVDSFEKPMFETVPEDVKENWIDQLTIRQFNEELKDVFPYIYRLVGEGTRAKALGPDDLLGEETVNKDLSEDDRYRSNKNYQLIDPNYNNFKIYVSVDRIVQNQYMATAVSNASDKEPEGIRTLANKPEAAVEEVKQKLDNRTAKAKKVTGNATLDFNAAFTRDFFENDADNLGVENFKMMYIKIVPGPKLIVANTAEYSDMPDLLTSDGFSRAGNRQQQGNPMASVTLSSKRVQNAELVANGRYIIGDPKQDKDGHYVYPMMFESIVLDKGEKVRFKKPAVTVGSSRVKEIEDLVSETSDEGKYQIVRKTDGKVLDTFKNEKFANQHYHVKKGWAEVKSNENEDKEVDESGLQYYTGVKKHGKEYMKKAAQAGREGASQEELGRLKDKYSKAEKTREEFELEQAFEDSMGQFSDEVCEECGNPSWRTFTEAEKQKGLDGKACWKGYRRQGTKMKGGKRVDNCVKVSEAEVGTVYMRFRERKTPQGETYLTAFAGFANSPEELQMDTASRKYMKLTRKEDIVKAVKDVKSDNVFVGAKDITVFVDNPALANKYSHLGEALNMLEKFGKKQGITVEYKEKDPNKKSEKGSGKKRLPKGHAASAMKNYKDADSERTTYFKIDNDSLMKFLKTKAPSIMNSFRPNLNMFVMDQKEYRSFRNWLKSEAVVARFGETLVRVDRERSFSQDKGREFEGIEQKEQKTPISEFILSYFDYTSGQFPKGETAVLTMIEKDYGEEFIEPAKQFIERINERVAEVMGYREEPEIQEYDSEFDRVRKLAGL